MLDRFVRSPSRTFLFLAAAFIVGAAVHALDERPWLPPAASLGSAASAGLLALLARRRPLPRLAAIGLALAALAVARYDLALRSMVAPGPLPAWADSFSGEVAEDPAPVLAGTVLIMDRVFVSGGGRLPGRFRLTSTAPFPARAGDILEWRCRPRPAGALGSAGAGDDLVLRGIAWQCAPRGRPAIVGSGRSGPVAALLASFRERLRLTVGELLPEPEASFLLGLLIGERAGLPVDLVDAFRRSGTSHILAVSGYNVTRLVDIIFVLCACAALRRRRASAVVALLLLGFVALVGGGASVVRAAIMGGVGLLAAASGRRYGGSASLAAAAAVMLAIDPLSLRHDIGFQLSFAAVWGLHAFGPALTAKLTFLPEAVGLRKTMAETLAATIATAPVVLAAFGRLPLVGPAANLLILPLVPWAMAFGTAAVVLAQAQPWLGSPPAFATACLLRFIEEVAARAPGLLPFSLELTVGPLAEAALFGWIVLLWFALNFAPGRPVLSPRGPADMDIEVIDHG